MILIKLQWYLYSALLTEKIHSFVNNLVHGDDACDSSFP